MFKKPFNVKSNVNLRNSDWLDLVLDNTKIVFSRKLLKRLDPAIAEALPRKATISQVKITTFNGVQLNIYLFDKIPLFFDDSPEGYLVPTVYAAWEHAECCPILVIPENVYGYLENGADLMLQGVIVNSTIKLPTFDRGAPVAIATLGKDGQIRGPLAIGASFVSSEMMEKCSMQGKGVQIMHMFRDHLWEMGPRTQQPILSPAILQAQLAPLDNESQESQVVTQVDTEEPTGSAEQIPNEEVPRTQESETTVKDDDESPDDLILRCFLAALRYRLGKAANFPYDVGQFYSHCLLKCVPEGKRLDIKKTKYKKFANFLTEINKHTDGPLLRIVAKGKGADVIEEVNWEHPLISKFKLTDEKTRDEPNSGKSLNTKAPRITELLAITEVLTPLLRALGAQYAQYNKGDLVRLADVRNMIVSYAKNQNLQEGNSVKLDPLLSQITGLAQEKADWNTIVQKATSRLTKTFVIDLPDGRQIVRKLKMPTISFKMETRSGNKKVTLVNNISAFGLDPREIAHSTQVGVAASATLGTAPNCEGMQVIVQGNQVAFIGDLLIRTYGVDRRFIEGLELAPKKKK